MSELKPRITENGIDYILVGDYYIPDLKLPEEHRPIGKYGRMHREAYVWRGHYHCGADGDSTALHTVLIRDSSSWVESLTRSLIS